MFKYKFSKTVLLLTIIAIFSNAANAATTEQKTINTAVAALFGKIQKDLAVEKLDLRLGEISTHALKNQFEVIGTATANDMPINFDVKVDARTVRAIEINYDFVSAEQITAEFAEADLEVILNQILMNKLRNDFKTKNIVIAPDAFEPTEIAGKKVYKGSGEVSIGGIEWSIIKFEITFNETNRLKSAVKYKIQN